MCQRIYESFSLIYSIEVIKRAKTHLEKKICLYIWLHSLHKITGDMLKLPIEIFAQSIRLLI